MIISKEVSLREFEAWSGAVDTLDNLTEDEIDQLEVMLDECNNGDIWDETELNDFLWFETDTIAEWLGYEDWEALIEHHSLEDDDEENEEDEYEEDYEE